MAAPVTLVTGANYLDQLPGIRWLLDIAPWVTAGGAGTFVQGGLLDEDLEVEETLTKDRIKPGNSLGATKIFFTDHSIIIRATLLQAGLRKVAVGRGGQEADVLVASGAATLPLGTPAVIAPQFQVRLKNLDALSLKPAYTEFATDVYVSRTLTLWSCTITPRGPRQLA